MSTLTSRPVSQAPRLTATAAHVYAHDWRTLGDEALIEAVLEGAPSGRVAVVTSFGTESAVLLDMVARVDRTAPVVFVDTGKLFAETLAYRDQLIDRLGLADVRTLSASIERVAEADPHGDLHQTDADACCRVRKVEPYVDALAEFDIEISGRKRFQGGGRSELETVERFGNRLKINPLAHWNPADIDEAYTRRALPRHPLFFDGYNSLGCEACTRPCAVGEAPRDGRWVGSNKTECGIHFAFGGGVPAAVRSS